jgi:cyclopropane-fatty-acyl-phospholipid synthase
MPYLNHTEISSNACGGLIADFARKLLFKRLQQIPKGQLRIIDGQRTDVFGQANNHAEFSGTIVVHDHTAIADIAFGGSLGAAEAYMQGKWSSPNLVQLVRLMSANIDFLNSMDDNRFFAKRLTDRFYHWLNRNNHRGSRQNIAAHYDLSNDFFALFLDPEMMYSAAVFENEDTDLDTAALFKLDLVCQKLALKPEDHLLEIGTGWGGMALYAAQNYGCRVTTTTISQQQYEAACQRVAEAGLEDRVTVLCEDYRNLTGQFDKLVSIEMIEAVGSEYYREYFRGCASLLKDNGLMLLQAITIPAQRYQYAQDSVDFIQRYIFPGGSLPSHEAILTSVRQHTDLEMINMQEIGSDYAKTLDIWCQRFMNKLEDVRSLGFDERFIRMWHFYLCYCQGAFEERVIGTSQMLLAKPDWRA